MFHHGTGYIHVYSHRTKVMSYMSAVNGHAAGDSGLGW